MFKVTLVILSLQMLLPFFSEAGSLKESLDAIRANANSVTSGSITYSISSFRPKENLLGAPSRDGYGGTGVRYTGENDVVLPGSGWVKWNGDSVLAETVRYYLVPTSENSLATKIVVERECSIGDGGKILRTTYQSERDALTNQLDGFHYGPIVEQLGSVQGPAKFQGSLAFKQIQYVILPLLSRNFLLKSKYESELSYSEIDNLLLVQRSSERSFTLDPKQGFLPVQEVIGIETPYLRSTTKFLQTGRCWLPETNTSEYWEGDLRYIVTCTTVSHEIGRDYPKEDFTINFPSGIELVDRYDGDD
jgi:hypothetical protein